jgi:predicted cupin superfamily sugar epimerase
MPARRWRSPSRRTAGRARRSGSGPDLLSGERPQILVPAGAWQMAESLGAWTLAGCTVAPGFVFEGFELAPPAGSRAGNELPKRHSGFTWIIDRRPTNL